MYVAVRLFMKASILGMLHRRPLISWVFDVFFSDLVPSDA
jgi:hypothetical protein